MEYLQAKHGQVWDTSELAHDFIVIGFSAPLVVVKRKSDNQKGSLMFQANPRFYFGFEGIDRDTTGRGVEDACPTIQTGGECNVSLFTETTRRDPGKTGV